MLQKTILSCGKSVPEQGGKEILKQLKSGLSDKAFVIQRIAAEVSVFYFFHIIRS